MPYFSGWHLLHRTELLDGLLKLACALICFGLGTQCFSQFCWQ